MPVHSVPKKKQRKRQKNPNFQSGIAVRYKLEKKLDHPESTWIIMYRHDDGKYVALGSNNHHKPQRLKVAINDLELVRPFRGKKTLLKLMFNP